MQTLKGVGIGNGIAIGKVLLLLDEDTVIVEEPVDAARIEKEVARFEDAIEKAKVQIRSIKAEVQSKIGEEHAFIFDTHAMFLDDSSLRNETILFIRKKMCTAQWAFSQVLLRILKEFSSLGDSYFVERAKDLEDVGKRLLRILTGNQEMGYHNLMSSDVIVIGSEFGPSNITRFDNPSVVGFATDLGGKTTHTAIIAKALGIPAVLGLHDVTKHVLSGDIIILDSLTGTVIVNPDKATLKKYQKLNEDYRHEEALYAREIKETAPTTKDGKDVYLYANIELPGEVDAAIKFGAQGIGLYRTEFLFLHHQPALPSEEDHYQTYCQIAEKMKGLPVTIRTLDLGGEKFFHRTFVREKEMNPVMGLRAVRLCLARKDVFRIQLRALLRAIHRFPSIRIMFPLITGISEFRDVMAFLHHCRDELAVEGVDHESNPEVGIMIEVPSAALVADYLAKEVSFFSIGTNDLIQYFLAIDRANDDVSYLYNPFHPGFVRLIKTVVEAAERAGIQVSCCGEMASNPLNACLLMHLGMRHLSMNPSSLPTINHLVRTIDVSYFEKVLGNFNNMPTGEQISSSFTHVLRDMLSAKDFGHLIGKD